MNAVRRADAADAGGSAGAPAAPPPHRAAAVRRPDLDTVFSINPDGSRNAIHPADVRGRFQRRKRALWCVLIAVYLALPWVKVGGRPALLIDIEHRHFHLFGATFDAQDFWLAFFFVTAVGFALFVLASLFGRVWCGYACPQTVFLEGVFRRVERLLEGAPKARLALDRAGLGQKLVRRGVKLTVFVLLAAVVSHSLLGYFMPVEVLVAAITSSPATHPTAFAFMVVATTLLFVDFTWFREQTCIVVCPYGRLQGALGDPDTVLVGYDGKRGEPRGPVGTAGAGACVDCYRCVAVCPTGIDIRNGNQLECVGCAACIDACDEVMQKLHRARGLVRYDSERGFETGQRRFWRGRVVLYLLLTALGIGVFACAATRRHAFEANLTRARGTAYAIEGDRVHNVFELHVINKRPGERTFAVAATGPAGAEVIVPERELRLASLQERRIPVHVFVPVAAFVPGTKCELRVRCDEEGGALERVATATLLGPSARR